MEPAVNSSDARQQLEARAAEALKAALAEVSTIKVREIRHAPPRAGRENGLMACVDVFGHRHNLACEVENNGQPHLLRSALEEMRKSPGHLRGDTTPVIIAPYLSPEAQALCKKNHAGYVDLEGNASLALGEVFIAKRTLPRAGQHSSLAAHPWPVGRAAGEKFTAASERTKPIARRAGA
jgi:hypothetical protein